MNQPSSRTPEGVPHRCDVCGNEFQLNRSIAGDVCCPNCNSLAWPIGDAGLESQSSAAGTTATRTKEVRIRPDTAETDLSDKTRRVISLLRKQNDVQLSVLFRRRSPEHQEKSKAVLESLIRLLVPEHATVKSPAHIATRRICATLTPTNLKRSGQNG